MRFIYEITLRPCNSLMIMVILATVTVRVARPGTYKAKHLSFFSCQLNGQMADADNPNYRITVITRRVLGNFCKGKMCTRRCT